MRPSLTKDREANDAQGACVAAFLACAGAAQRVASSGVSPPPVPLVIKGPSDPGRRSGGAKPDAALRSTPVGWESTGPRWRGPRLACAPGGEPRLPRVRARRAREPHPGDARSVSFTAHFLTGQSRPMVQFAVALPEGTACEDHVSWGYSAEMVGSRVGDHRVGSRAAHRRDLCCDRQGT